MQWNSVSEFFAMGGYALYVWGSFGLTVLVVGAEVLQVRARQRALWRNLLAGAESTATLQQELDA